VPESSLFDGRVVINDTEEEKHINLGIHSTVMLESLRDDVVRKGHFAVEKGILI
jgi:hypothetical protein